MPDLPREPMIELVITWPLTRSGVIDMAPTDTPGTDLNPTSAELDSVWDV